MLQQALKTGRKIAFFLDYDGTLIPIKLNRLAVSAELSNLLNQLLRRPSLFIAIVTGRTLSDIERKFPLQGLSFVGNHGFQISLNGRRWEHPQAKKFTPILHQMYLLLKKELEMIHNVIVEDKHFTISIHYRKADPRDTESIKRKVKNIIEFAKVPLVVRQGKRVLNLRPPIPWDKGCAVLKMLKTIRWHERPLVICVGDDETDEDMFKRLRHRAMTIRVGKNQKTTAQYYLKNPQDVHRLLKRCAAYGNKG